MVDPAGAVDVEGGEDKLDGNVKSIGTGGGCGTRLRRLLRGLLEEEWRS